MGKTLLFLLLGAINVHTCLSQTVWRIEDVHRMEQPLGKVYETFEDGPPPETIPPGDILCYRVHKRCVQREPIGNLTYVCAYQKLYGLVRFQSVCDINLENCLIESYESRTGELSKREPYFYNNRGKSCKYYVDQANTLDDAIKLYYLHAFKIRDKKLRKRIQKFIGVENFKAPSILNGKRDS